MSRGAALDELNEALKAAEKHIYDLKFGVSATVNVDVWDLTWGKHEGSWRLTIDGTPLLQALAEQRIKVPKELPRLLAELRMAADRNVRDVHEATKLAREFVGSKDG